MKKNIFWAQNTDLIFKKMNYFAFIWMVIICLFQSQAFVTLQPSEDEEILEQCIHQDPEPQTLLKSYEQIRLSYSEYEEKFYKKADLHKDYRRLIFNENLLFINQHNSYPNRTFDLGVNQFLHLSTEEFIQTHTGLRRRIPPIVQQSLIKSSEQLPISSLLTSTDPEEKETESKNLLTLSTQNIPVPQKNVFLAIDWSCHCGQKLVRSQGVCSASYAFAITDTIASIESIYQENHFFISLSPQHLISAKEVKNIQEKREDGCTGSSFQETLQLIEKEGVHFEWNYMYENGNFREALPAKQIESIFKTKGISSWKEIQNKCDEIVKVLQRKPIAAGIHADKNLQFYKRGLFSAPENEPNHAVMMIGFNSQYGFWFKNSWGSQWGQNGFGWVSQTENAGICSYAIDIVVNEKSQELPPKECCLEQP